MGRLVKLVNAGASTFPQALGLISASLNARDPSTYFGKAISELERDAGLREPAATNGKRNGKSVPAFVSEWRAAGIQIDPAGPHRWQSEGRVYDDSGGLIGW